MSVTAFREDQLNQNVVAITGGRNYTNIANVHYALGKEYTKAPFELLVHGNCPTGVDKIAADWAYSRGIKHTAEKYSADWTKHGNAAGPIRNRAMLKVEAPRLLIVMPGGRGTKDCASAAKELGIPLVTYGG